MSTDRHWLAPVITWRSLLVQHSTCSTCKLVGLALSLYMNERGGSAFPSVPTLADDCSLAESTTREHLNGHLHAQGWLFLVERGGQKGDRRRANEWRATTPPGIGGVTPPGDDGTPPGNDADPTGSRPPSSSGTSPRNGEGRSFVCCGVTFLTLTDYMDHQEGPNCQVVS